MTSITILRNLRRQPLYCGVRDAAGPALAFVSQWATNLYANVFLMEHWGKDSLVRSVGTGPPSRRDN